MSHKVLGRAVLIFSGGMDSTTLLYWMWERGWAVYPLSVFYGQRHNRELDSAAKICSDLGLPFKEADLGSVGKKLLKGSSQTDQTIEVPHGHYEDENMKMTVVPNRNMIMLSVAIGYAISIGASAVFYGAHAGDHAIYPDCRSEFVSAMREAARLCHFDGGIQIEAPFTDIDKGDIVIEGLKLNVPYKDTWTCYEGRADGLSCGECGACQERLEAFSKAGVVDPIPYADLTKAGG